MSFIYLLSNAFERFEAWFDRHFGWFFTNGMKEQQQYQEQAFKA